MTSLLRRWLPSAIRPSTRLVSTTAPLTGGGLRDISPSSRLLDDDDSQKLIRSFVTPSSSYKQQLANTEKKRASLADVAASQEREAYSRRNRRPWARGTVYAPRDLGPAAQRRWRNPAGNPRGDPLARDFVDEMGFNPLDNYRNFALISENMTAFGRIKKGRLNGLRPVNQRKMAKAIRRAVGLGIHPSVHLHPEILLAPNKHVTHGTLPSTQMPSKGRDKL